MGKNFNIFNSGKEQKLLAMLYGSIRERNKAITILRQESLKYCFYRGRKLGFSSDETNELFQDTIVAFIVSLQRNSIDKNPAGYLRMIFKNKSIDKLNKKKGMAFVSLEQIELSTDEDDKNKESKQLTETAMNKMCNAMKHLSSNQQTLFNCYYILKMSLKEIAVEQNTTPEVIKTQLSRARKALRDKLREL